MAAPAKSNPTLNGWVNIPSTSTRDIPSAKKCEKIRKIAYAQLGEIVNQQIFETKNSTYCKISLYTIHRPNGNILLASSGLSNPPHNDAELAGLGFEIIAEANGKKLDLLHKSIIVLIKKVITTHSEIAKGGKSNKFFLVKLPYNKKIPSRFKDAQENIIWLLGISAPAKQVPDFILLTNRKTRLITAKLLKSDEMSTNHDYYQYQFRQNGTYHITYLDQPTVKIWTERFWDDRIVYCMKEMTETTQKKIAQIETAEGEKKKKLLGDLSIAHRFIYCLSKAFTLLDKIPCIPPSRKDQSNYMAAKKAVFIKFIKEFSLTSGMEKMGNILLTNLPAEASILEFKYNLLCIMQSLQVQSAFAELAIAFDTDTQELLTKLNVSKEFRVNDTTRCIDCGKLLVNEKESEAAVVAAPEPAKTETGSKKKPAENPPAAGVEAPLSYQISISMHRIQEIAKELHKDVAEIDENLNRIDASETTGKKSKKWKKKSFSSK